MPPTKIVTVKTKLIPSLVQTETPIDANLKHFHQVPGWFDGTTQELLRAWARDAMVILNLGVWKGRSALEMAEETSGVIYAVDHFLGSPESLDTTQAQGRDAPISLYLEFLAYVDHFGLRDKIIPICGESIFVSQYFPPHSIDLAFIDGSHESDAVYRDLDAWYPKVAPGGILCGHDFNRSTVSLAVDQWMRDNGIAYKVDMPIWFVENGDG